jgi:hypothetical protein
VASEKHEWQYARVGFRIAPQVLAHTRKYCSFFLACGPAGEEKRSTHPPETLRDRNQLARSWMDADHSFQRRHQRRAARS